MVDRFNDRPEIAVAREHSEKSDDLIIEIQSLKAFMAPLIELAHVQLALLKGPSPAPEAPEAPPSIEGDHFLQ